MKDILKSPDYRRNAILLTALVFMGLAFLLERSEFDEFSNLATSISLFVFAFYSLFLVYDAFKSNVIKRQDSNPLQINAKIKNKFILWSYIIFNLGFGLLLTVNGLFFFLNFFAE